MQKSALDPLKLTGVLPMQCLVVLRSSPAKLDYLRQGYAFTPVCVCCLLLDYSKTTNDFCINFVEWLDTVQGPID